VSEGHSLVAIPFGNGNPGYPGYFDRIGVTLRALLANQPQESSDVSATPEVAEIPDPEAEAYANVKASTSLPDHATSLPVT